MLHNSSSAHAIQHQKVPSYWPQANAEVECFNQPLEKIIRGAHIEHKDWRQEINKFLLNFRYCPCLHTHRPLSVDGGMQDTRYKQKFPAS